MSEFAHWLINELPDDFLKKVEEIIAEKKFGRKLFTRSSLSDEEYELLERALEAYELILIDLWDNEEKKIEFSTFNKKCFDILQVFPIPSDDVSKIKHVLKLVIYSYLGEKWEDGRRFLVEEENVWKVRIDEGNSWDEILFKRIYLAILYLVRKSSWEDLRNAIELINKLREEQKKYEKDYLSSIEPEFKRGAALEIASFYHLARSVEILGEFMLKGEPISDRVISELEYHLDKGIKFCDLSNSFEFSFLLRLLLAMFKKMVFNSIYGELRRKN